MNCVNCGTNNSNGAIFCNACGRALAGGQEMRGIFPRKQNVDSSTNRNSIDQKRRMITMKSLKMKAATALLLVGTMMTAVTACGKSEQQETYYEDTNFSEEVAKTITALDAADSEREEQWEAYKKEQKTVMETYKKYPKNPAWDTAKTNEQPIQIDDVFFKNGEKVSDVMDRFNASDVNYEYDYTADKLIIDGKGETIIIKRDGYQWITLYANNPFDEATPLKDIAIVNYHVDDKAIPYIYILDGKSFDDYSKMTYSSIKEDPVLSQYRVDESEGIIKDENGNSKDVITIMFTNYGTDDESPTSVYWTGYSITNPTPYYFTADAVTQEIIEMTMPDNNLRSNFGPLPSVPLQSLSEIPEDVYQTEWVDWATESVIEHYEVPSAEYLGTLVVNSQYHDYKDGEELPCVSFIMVYALPDGQFGQLNLQKIMIDANGEATNSFFNNFWTRYDSLEEIKEKYQDDTIESTLP